MERLIIVFDPASLNVKVVQTKLLCTKANDSFLFSSFLQLSYADISFVEFFNNLSLLVKKQKDEGKPAVPDLEELFKKFPLLDGHYKRVLDVPEIKAWVEKRPASDF